MAAGEANASAGMVAVATDSSACLPRDLADAWGVLVAPLQVIVDDEAFEEGDGIAPSAVVDALVAGRRVTTSQPGPLALASVAERAAEAGASHLVFVCLSGAISGTAEAMAAAAASAPLPVTVVDSKTVAMATGLAAVSAAAVARAGGSPQDVAEEARRAADASLSLFTVDTLEYLRRGGRISDTAAALGNALGVKPVLGVVDGRIDQIERVRTSAKARESVLVKIAEHAGALERPVVGVMTLAGDEETAASAAKTLALSGSWPVVHAGLSAVLAAHGGPGSLAVTVVDAYPAVWGSLG